MSSRPWITPRWSRRSWRDGMVRPMGKKQHGSRVRSGRGVGAAGVEGGIRAVVALAPGGSSRPKPGILPGELTFAWGRDVPTLYLVAENDVMTPLAGMHELFERTPATKRMVILRRADHIHFLDDVEREHEAARSMKWAGALAWISEEMRDR